MSLKPLALGLIVSIVLSGGLAIAAHAASHVLQGGAEGLAALLSRSGASRDAEPAANSTDHPRAAPPASPSATTPSRTDGVARKEQGASASTSDPTLRSTTPGPKLPRVTPSRVLRLRTDAPTCNDVYVYIVSIFENVADSMATLALDAKERGRPRRVGQRLGRYEIIGIGYNASRVSSAVWLAEGSRVCQALVRAANPVREKQHLRQLPRAQQLAAAQLKARKKKAKSRSAKRQR